MSAEVAAALAEPDVAKRAALYAAIQREHQAESPFVVMFQDIHVVAERKGVEGFEVGPNFDTVYYRAATKN
jgi:peptide/nickel transport system substrate-binding protein